jgi:hypothetical protein
MDSFEKRLNGIWSRITSHELLQNKGLGKEIGIYIFDYPPEKELQMREHVNHLLKRLQKERSDIKVVHVDLFDMLINYLKKRNLLDRALSLEKDKGTDGLIKALSGTLSPQNIANEFIEIAKPQENDLILVSGVGKTWPLLRSHNLLNNLQPLIGQTPLVLFYPGEYSGHDLRLFNIMEENNYYRAFRLI